MARKTRTFDEITKEATSPETSPEGMTVKDRGYFHMFNPNGALAKKRAADDAISAAIDAGILKSGAYFAYGSMNDFHEKRLTRFAMRKHCRGWDIDYHAKALEKDAAKAYAAIEAAQIKEDAA